MRCAKNLSSTTLQKQLWKFRRNISDWNDNLVVSCIINNNINININGKNGWNNNVPGTFDPISYWQMGICGQVCRRMLPFKETAIRTDIKMHLLWVLMIHVYPISATGLEFLLEQYAEPLLLVQLATTRSQSTYTMSSSRVSETTSPYTQSSQNIFNSSYDDTHVMTAVATVNSSQSNSTSFQNLSTTSLMNFTVSEDTLSSPTITGEVKKLRCFSQVCIRIQLRSIGQYLQ